MANFREFMALRTAFETLIKTLAHILDLVKLFALIYDVNSPQCHFQAFHIVNAFIQNALLTIIFTLSQSFFIFHSCVVSKILSQKLHVRLFFEYSDSVIVERWKAKVVSWILALAEQKKEWISCYQSIIQPPKWIPRFAPRFILTHKDNFLLSPRSQDRSTRRIIFISLLLQ